MIIFYLPAHLHRADGDVIRWIILINETTNGSNHQQTAPPTWTQYNSVSDDAPAAFQLCVSHREGVWRPLLAHSITDAVRLPGGAAHACDVEQKPDPTWLMHQEQDTGLWCLKNQSRWFWCEPSLHVSNVSLATTGGLLMTKSSGVQSKQEGTYEGTYRSYLYPIHVAAEQLQRRKRVTPIDSNCYTWVFNVCYIFKIQ